MADEVKTGTEVKVETPAAPEPKGEAKAPEAKPTAKGGAIDLDTKVKVGGQEFTVADLAAEAQTSVEFKGNVYKTLDASSSQESRADAMRQILVHLGTDPKAIEEYMAANYGKGPAPKDEAEPLEARLADMEKSQKKAAMEALDENLGQVSKKLLDNDPKVKVYLDAAERLGGKPQREKAEVAIQKALRKGTIEQMHLKKAQTGKSAEKGWVNELMPQIIDDVLESVGGAVIGDPNKIRKAPETDTGTNDVLSVSSRTPVSAPEYKVGKSRGDLDKDVEAWLTDTRVRDAAKIGTGESRV